MQKAPRGCRWTTLRPDIGDSHPSSGHYATLAAGWHRSAWFAHEWSHWVVIPYTPYPLSLGVYLVLRAKLELHSKQNRYVAARKRDISYMTDMLEYVVMKLD